MHILVTDLLTCVRCGPEFGLILIADRIEDRRVIEGSLGCSNCRERYPVEGGFADLRMSPRSDEEPDGLDLSDDPQEALKLAALLGVREGGGLLMLSGTAVAQAQRIAAMLEGIDVVAAHLGLRREPETEGVTRIATGSRIPFRSSSLLGVALEGDGGGRRLAEGVRVLAPGRHLVFLSPPPGTGARMEAEGLELLLEAESLLVGRRTV